MKNRKINIIDILLIVTVVLLIGIAVYRYFLLRRANAAVLDHEITYTVCSEEMDTELLYDLQVGDTLFLAASGTPCGTIAAIDASYGKRETQYDNGTMREHTDPGRASFVLEIHASADTVNEYIRFSEDASLYRGESASFYTKSLAFDGTVLTVALLS